MKSILLTLSIVISIFLSPLAAHAASPPEMIIRHDAIGGESPSASGRYLAPRKDMEIRLFPSIDSPVVDSIHNGEILNVLVTEVHAYPRHGATLVAGYAPRVWGKPMAEANRGKPTPVKGDYIYLLYYGGEGTYLAWYDNNIIRVSQDGIDGLKTNRYGDDSTQTWARYQGKEELGDELWICVRKLSGIEGWIRFSSTNDWITSEIGSIFLRREYIEGSLKNRYFS